MPSSYSRHCLVPLENESDRGVGSGNTTGPQSTEYQTDTLNTYSQIADIKPKFTALNRDTLHSTGTEQMSSSASYVDPETLTKEPLSNHMYVNGDIYRRHRAGEEFVQNYESGHTESAADSDYIEIGDDASHYCRLKTTAASVTVEHPYISLKTNNK